MTSPLVTVAPDETLGAAMVLMEQHRVHHLLVIEGNRMAGILSSADMLKVALLRRPDAEQELSGCGELDIRVRDIMQSRVAVLRQSANLKDAASALSLGGFHAVPVLAIDDTPVGIVTSSDLVGLLMDQIEREAPSSVATKVPPEGPRDAVMPRLLDVLRAAEIYLHSGQSGQQHAQLTRAVARAREFAVDTEGSLRL